MVMVPLHHRTKFIPFANITFASFLPFIINYSFPLYQQVTLLLNVHSLLIIQIDIQQVLLDVPCVKWQFGDVEGGLEMAKVHTKTKWRAGNKEWNVEIYGCV